MQNIKILFLGVILFWISIPIFAYESRSIGMGGISTISLGVMGGGQNPAFVDLNNLEVEALGGIGTGFNVDESIKINLFTYYDILNRFVYQIGGSSIGGNIVYTYDNTQIILGYGQETIYYGYTDFDSRLTDIVSIGYIFALFDSSKISLNTQYRHSSQIAGNSNIYRTGASLQTQFSLLQTVIGYEKTLGENPYGYSNINQLGLELSKLFNSPFSLQFGLLYSNNELFFSRGITYDGEHFSFGIAYDGDYKTIFNMGYKINF